MVDCPRVDIRDLLPDLVHDQLEPEARVRVEQHLIDCAECAAELELLRTLRATAFATPEVDADRIAAAVRGAIAGADSSRPTRRSIPQSWRIAAAIALVAAGAGGYALTRGGSAMFAPQAERATVAAASESSAPAAAPAGAPVGAPSPGAAKAGAPAPSLAAASDMAGFSDSGSDAATSTTSPLILGDAVNELSESDMQALLQSMDDLQAMPDLEPHQLPLLATVVEGAL